MEILVTAISLIEQSKISGDERCKILINSLQVMLHGIETKSYGRDQRGKNFECRLSCLLETLTKFGFCVLVLQIDPVLVVENDAISAPNVITLSQESVKREVEKMTAVVKKKGNAMKFILQIVLSVIMFRLLTNKAEKIGISSCP